MDINQNGSQGNAPEQQPNQQYQPINNQQFQQPAQQFNGGYVPTPEVTQKPKKPIYKRWWFWVIIVIVVLGIIGGAGSSDEKSESSATTTIEEITEGTTSDTEEQKDTEATENKVIKAGESIDLDGLKITYVSCNADFKKYSEYADVKSGYKVIRAEFLYENNSDRDMSLEGFECYADNDKCEEFYSVDDYASPTLESISKGRKFKGVVYYQVPKDAKIVELECETSFWSDSKLTFEVK